MTDEQKKTLIEDILDEQYDDITSDFGNTSYKYGWNQGLKRATIRIEAFKEERPHGEWTSNSHDLELFCSVCGGALPYSDEYTYEADFCPNCGADMREGEVE